MQRRSFLKGILSTSAVAAVPAIQGKELESLLVPDKEVLLPTKFESIALATGFEPPFAVRRWKIELHNDLRGHESSLTGALHISRMTTAQQYLLIEAEFRDASEVVTLKHHAIDAAHVTWDMPFLRAQDSAWETLRINGAVVSADVSLEPDSFTTAHIKVMLLESVKHPGIASFYE